MRTRSPQKPLRYFLFSIGIHVFFTLATLWSSSQEPLPTSQAIEVEIAPPTPTEVVPTPKVKQPKAVETPKNQIVDQDENRINDETPEDTRFLSRHNQTVKKQTVAQERGEFKNKASEEPHAGNQGSGNTLDKVDLKPKFDIVKSVENQIQKEREFEESAEGLRPAQTLPTPPDQAQKSGEGAGQKGADVSQTLDYIKDLDAGLETMLSTKEFVYYTYFNRIRTQLNQYWSDRVRKKMTEIYKKGRTIASTDDKITKCLVTLDRTGKLIKIQIIGDSGVRELDEAAVEAFRSAAPFPNPPDGMIDSDGTIKIRWDFILEA